MSIKNILVAYSGQSASQMPLRRAFRIAQHHDAWVTGVVGHGTSLLLSRFGGRAPQEAIEGLRQADQQEIKKAMSTFDRMAKEAGREHAAECVELFDEDGASVASFSRTFDLVVTGPHSGKLSEDHMSANPDLIALQSGRPVLIVPKRFDATALAKHVVVAWDGKRAAARAVGDAMPLLEDHGRVTVLTIGKQLPPGTRRLVENLKRHEIVADYLQKIKSGSVGATLLHATEDIGADLILMGAYEHSKFAYDFFGGVTTDVMNQSAVPVFMSH